ncbi:MAG: BMP family ABC transporter substrate-binding protein [Clostridia bacterium]
MKKKLLSSLLTMALSTSLLLTGCGSEDTTNTGNTDSNNNGNTNPGTTQNATYTLEELKVGVLYVGPIGDEGYSYAHHQGILEMQQSVGLTDDQILFVENVSEDSECETTIRDLIDQGCNVIYATSFGHMDWTASVAKDFPDVYFSHATGYTMLDNMSNYMGRIYEARYLSGIAAGLNTTTNKIGFVAAMPIPEVIRGIDAFALGVKSVNPDATVEVKWINSWYDPTLEKSTAVDLINSGCDVIAQHCDTTGPQIAAEEAGASVLAVGYNASTIEVAPTSYITAPLFHWGTFYTAEINSILDGTYTAQSYYEGLVSGMVSLDAINEAVVVDGTKEAIETAKEAIMAGELYVFDGPIFDNQGNEVYTEGESMTDADILSMTFFVDNVIGTTN